MRKVLNFAVLTICLLSVLVVCQEQKESATIKTDSVSVKIDSIKVDSTKIDSVIDTTKIDTVKKQK